MYDDLEEERCRIDEENKMFHEFFFAFVELRKL